MPLHAFALTIDRNLMHGAEVADAQLTPAIPFGRAYTETVENRGNALVRQRAWQFVLQPLDLLLEPRNRRQTFIPSPFELAGDQPVIGINHIILAACMRHLIARLFQCEFALPQSFRTGPLAIGNQLE